jgi:hypothetical protein
MEIIEICVIAYLLALGVIAAKNSKKAAQELKKID